MEIRRTLLITGPQQAGKTTFIKSARNEKLNDKELVTQWEKRYRIGWFKGCYDTPGSSDTLNKRKLNKLFKEYHRIVYMFRANTFLEEINAPEKGGIINAEIKNLIIPIWNEIRNDYPDKRLFFIANKENDDDRSTDNIIKEILSKMEEANNTYRKKTGQLRYPHIVILKESAHFYCVDATNCKDVQEITNKLFL